MKKIFLLAAMVMALISCTAFAAQTATGSTYGSTKVVIIGGAEFKTQDYYKLIQKTLGSKTKTLYECGDEIQSNYQMFMIEKYDIGEHLPNKQDMIEFVSSNGYSNVLFLKLNETIDTQNNAKSRQKNRITIQLDAYLVDSSKIAKSSTTSQDFISKTSNLRARRGAFEKCLKEVAKTMNLY